MAIREGKWDCIYCGRAGNRGPDKHCMGCGAPRDANVKFYLPEDAAEVTDQKTLAEAQKIPDWHCSFCGGDNPGDAKFCPNCGGGADGTEPRRKVQDIMDQTQAAQPQKGKPIAGKKILWGAIAALVAIGLGLYFFVFRTHEETLEVKSHAWERSIEIEKFKTVNEESWEGEVPGDARVLSRYQAVYKTEKIQVGSNRVKTGKRDLGNGYFEDIYEDKPVYQEKPVYKDKVRYTVDRWRQDRTLKESGKDLTPRWPVVALADREREGKRQEAYRVFFVSGDGKEREWTAKNEAQWSYYKPGTKHKAKVRASGGIADLEPPAEKP